MQDEMMDISAVNNELFDFVKQLTNSSTNNSNNQGLATIITTGSDKDENTSYQEYLLKLKSHLNNFYKLLFNSVDQLNNNKHNNRPINTPTSSTIINRIKIKSCLKIYGDIITLQNDIENEIKQRQILQSEKFNDILNICKSFFIVDYENMSTIISESGNFLIEHDLLIPFCSICMWLNGDVNLANFDAKLATKNKQKMFLRNVDYWFPDITPFDTYLYSIVNVNCTSYTIPSVNNIITSLQKKIHWPHHRVQIINKTLNCVHQEVFTGVATAAFQKKFAKLNQRSLLLLELKNREYTKVSNVYASLQS